MALFIEEIGVGGDNKNDIYGQSFCLRQCTSHYDEYPHFILTTTYLKVIIIPILQKTTLEVERVLVQGHLAASADLTRNCPLPPQLSQSEYDRAEVDNDRAHV